MKIGFIGTGAIAEAVIVGLVEHGSFTDPVVVSARSRSRADKLSARFTNVTVEPENQDIVDAVDVLFIAVLPGQAIEVLESLVFSADQTIVSLVAGISVERIQSIAQPATRVHRLIPMPPNEIGVGPLPIYPPSPELEPLLSKIGTVIDVTDESHFSTFSGASAMMATFFEFVATNARWIEHQGVPAEKAATYSSSLFHSLAAMTCEMKPDQLKAIGEECLTIGGLNEQVLNTANSNGIFEMLETELDLIRKRIAD
jgi:pyrroline-5-carboxylate reductase